MKKTYNKAEAYKVSFNANEQIAAASCQYLSSDSASSKYLGTVIGDLCDSSTGMYGSADMVMCYIDESGASEWLAVQYNY